jgi:hypothetical protein
VLQSVNSAFPRKAVSFHRSLAESALRRATAKHPIAPHLRFCSRTHALVQRQYQCLVLEGLGDASFLSSAASSGEDSVSPISAASRLISSSNYLEVSLSKLLCSTT